MVWLDLADDVDDVADVFFLRVWDQTALVEKSAVFLVKLDELSIFLAFQVVADSKYGR